MKLLRRKPDHQAGAPSPWFACDLFSEVRRAPDLPYGTASVGRDAVCLVMQEDKWVEG